MTVICGSLGYIWGFVQVELSWKIVWTWFMIALFLFHTDIATLEIIDLNQWGMKKMQGWIWLCFSKWNMCHFLFSICCTLRKIIGQITSNHTIKGSISFVLCSRTDLKHLCIQNFFKSTLFILAPYLKIDNQGEKLLSYKNKGVFLL